jgi:uncharacterized protein
MTEHHLNLSELWETPGEHAGFLPGCVGLLDARLMVPDVKLSTHVALLGHPHSLKGGSMQNKVVTTLARALKAHGIPSLRFNFRGVGASEGMYDAGLGESDDMLELVSQVRLAVPDSTFLFAGFSFGSFVAYRAAAQTPHKLLITVAPPVNHFDFTAFSPEPAPWVLFQGDDDEVIPSHLVLDFAVTRDITVTRFAETGHFFHGKLTDLKADVQDALGRFLV